MPRHTRKWIAVRDLTAPLLTAAPFVILWSLMLHFLPTQDNSDGLLQTIISLQKLTVYFWGQDRFGNLLPALTAWIHDPLENAWVQMALRVLTGLLAPVFFCSLAFRRPLDAWRATLATDCLFALVINPALGWEIYIEASPYGPSLTCCGLATLAARAASLSHGTTRLWTNLLCLGLLLIAYVVNFALVLLTLPLIGLLALGSESTIARRLLMQHSVAAVAGFMLPRVVAASGHTALGANIAIGSYVRYLDVIWANTHWTFVLAVGLPFLLSLATVRGLPRGESVFWAQAAMLAAAAVLFIAVASSQWLVTNQFHQRYFIPGYLLLISIGGISVWQLLRQSGQELATRNAVFAGVASLLLLCGFERLRELNMVTHGIIGDGKAPLAEAVGHRSLSLSLDGVAGDYWLVWPSVFMAEQYRYESNSERPDVLGITFRGDAKRKEFTGRLAKRGALRVGCIDIEVSLCAGFVASYMEIPGLRGTRFAPEEQLPDHHVLSFITVTQP